MAKRKIIIGLTGPIGSGCSELAEMFDDDTGNVERDIDKCALVRFLLSPENINYQKTANRIIHPK